MIVFALIFLPIILIILVLYYKNKYNREPLTVLLKYFLLGVVISFIAIYLEKFLISKNIFIEDTNFIYMAFIVAGFTEEVLKAIVLLFMSMREETYDQKLDGIMYSIFLSLGFSTIENIIYINFEKFVSMYQISLIRGIISIPAHIMFATTMGYYLSKYKFEKNKIKRREYICLMFLIPILIHGVFDFILIIQYKWTIIIFIAYLICLLKINLDKFNKYFSYSKKIFFKNLKRKKK